jgi:hypothetical protein
MKNYAKWESTYRQPDYEEVYNRVCASAGDGEPGKHFDFGSHEFSYARVLVLDFEDYQVAYSVDDNDSELDAELIRRRL